MKVQLVKQQLMKGQLMLLKCQLVVQLVLAGLKLIQLVVGRTCSSNMRRRPRQQIVLHCQRPLMWMWHH